MRALLLFAEDEVGCIEGWFRLADGQVVARGKGINHVPLLDDGERLYLVLAGSEVAMRLLDLPPLTEAQAQAAARIAVSEDSLGPIDALHVAIGPLHGGHRLAAAIAHERMGEWIDWASRAGLDPDHIVPLPLLIAYGEGPARVWTRPGRTLVRGRLEAFAIEPELAEAVLGDSPREAIDDATFEAELPAALAMLDLDLRQGPWRRRRAWRVDAGWRTRMIRYAVAAAILVALIPVARLGRLAWDGHRLRGEAARVAQATLGLPERPVDPREVLQQRLERLQGPGMGFVDSAAVLFGAVRQTPNVELADLRFDETGMLTANVRANSSADLAELVRRIGSSGLVVETTAGAGQGISNVTVRRP